MGVFEFDQFAGGTGRSPRPSPNPAPSASPAAATPWRRSPRQHHPASGLYLHRRRRGFLEVLEGKQLPPSKSLPETRPRWLNQSALAPRTAALAGKTTLPVWMVKSTSPLFWLRVDSESFPIMCAEMKICVLRAVPNPGGIHATITTPGWSAAACTVIKKAGGLRQLADTLAQNFERHASTRCARPATGSCSHATWWRKPAPPCKGRATPQTHRCM